MIVGMLPESADPRNWEIEIDGCCPEKLEKTIPNRRPIHFNVSISIQCFWVNTILKEAHLIGFSWAGWQGSGIRSVWRTPPCRNVCADPVKSDGSVIMV
ncbi:hypothetical protein CEXT_344661 [Caerostris extrusa]|uniref:Uncharacterized protein n=1 Tax=Caerostris extrusa TaxID=172846 RepID=A0AAV4P1M4_CAEEX|nr:hypothetical protein CEXT_344661 [Caerostris extrusa]